MLTANGSWHSCSLPRLFTLPYQGSSVSWCGSLFSFFALFLPCVFVVGFGGFLPGLVRALCVLSLRCWLFWLGAGAVRRLGVRVRWSLGLGLARSFLRFSFAAPSFSACFPVLLLWAPHSRVGSVPGPRLFLRPSSRWLAVCWCAFPRPAPVPPGVFGLSASCFCFTSRLLSCLVCRGCVGVFSRTVACVSLRSVWVAGVALRLSPRWQPPFTLPPFARGSFCTVVAYAQRLLPTPRFPALPGFF